MDDGHIFRFCNRISRNSLGLGNERNALIGKMITERWGFTDVFPVFSRRAVFRETEYLQDCLQD